MRYTPSPNEKSRSPRDNQLASLRLQISAWTNCVPNVCKMYKNKRLLVMSTDMPNAFHGLHNDVMKCEHFSHYWPLVRGIHRSPVNSPHKGQWRGPLLLCLICAWTNGWVNTRGAGDLRRFRAHYDVTVMWERQFVQLYRTNVAIEIVHKTISKAA